jgi:hypothetical protein
MKRKPRDEPARVVSAYEVSVHLARVPAVLSAAGAL